MGVAKHYKAAMNTAPLLLVLAMGSLGCAVSVRPTLLLMLLELVNPSKLVTQIALLSTIHVILCLDCVRSAQLVISKHLQESAKLHKVVMCAAPLLLELATPSLECVPYALMVTNYPCLELVWLKLVWQKFHVRLTAPPVFAIPCWANAPAAKWVMSKPALVTAKLNFLRLSALLGA